MSGSTNSSSVFIYALLDGLGCRRYIGKSINPSKRLKEHQRRGRPWAVTHEILEECDPPSTWFEREAFWITHGRSTGWPLENISDGGEPGWPIGLVHTKATRERLGEISHRRWQDPKYREKMRASFTLSVRARISKAASERSLAARRRISEANMGRTPWNKGLHQSAETRVKLSNAARRQWEDLETRQRFSLARLGRSPWNKGKRGHLSTAARANAVAARRRRPPVSHQARAAMSQSARRRWQDPEYRAKQIALRVSPSARSKLSESHRGHKHSAETRERMREAQHERRARERQRVEQREI